MNAVFGYRSTMTLGENLIVGVLTGTAVLLAALPRPDDNNSGKIFACSSVVMLCILFSIAG